MKKKSKMTEADRLIALQDKIGNTAESNRELERELRMLKKQQKIQGTELEKLENTETYQAKVRQLTEEVRVARELQMDQAEKLGSEEAAVARQRERIGSLSSQLQLYGEEETVDE